MLLTMFQLDMSQDVLCGAADAKKWLNEDLAQIPSALTTSFDRISVGRTTYHLIRPVAANHIPTIDGWACRLNELDIYVGRGKTPHEAREDLEIQIHTDFQRLYAKRPFEMTDDEQRRWCQIAGVIDVLNYRMTTPLVVREMGQVSYGKISRPYRIKWLNGKNYTIEPDKVPGELMSCAPGQWIEAVVLKDPMTFGIVEIQSITKVKFRLPTDSEIEEFWNDMPIADLDSGEWP
jgi:hypothetical protein